MHDTRDGFSSIHQTLFFTPCVNQLGKNDSSSSTRATLLSTPSNNDSALKAAQNALAWAFLADATYGIISGLEALV